MSEMKPTPLSLKYARMMRYADDVLRHYPKAKRRVVDKIIDNMWDSMLLIHRQQRDSKHRMEILTELSNLVDDLRIIVRASSDLKYISGIATDEHGTPIPQPKNHRSQYAIWSEMINDIGCDVGRLLVYAQGRRK